MENTTNYKEENENLRLKIELSKQKENEMKMEKELILLRKQNENITACARTDNIKQNDSKIDDKAKEEALERLFSFS